MIKYLTHISKIFEILSLKNKIYLILFFLSSIVIALLEVLSIGILAIYVGFLSNPDIILNKISIDFVKDYFIDLDKNILFIKVSFIIIFLFLIKNFVIIFINWFLLRIRQSIISANSNEIFNSILETDFKKLLSTTKSVLSYKVYDEIKRVGSFIVGYSTFLKELLIIFFLSLSLLILNKYIFFSILTIFSLISLISVNSFKGTLRKSADKMNKHSSLMLKSLLEVFDNLILIKLSSKKKFFINKYLNHLNLQIKFTNFKSLISTLPRSIFEIIGISIVMIFVIVEIYRGTNTQNILPLISFVALVSARMIPSYGAITHNFSLIIFNEKSFLDFYENRKKIFKVYNDIYENTSKLNLDYEDLKITLKDITYAYVQNENVLDNVNYTFEKDKIYGIVGKSGSGKSTITKVMMGLLKPLKGEVLFNKSPLNKNYRNFQDLIGYVPQNIFLIDSTIESNIAMGENMQEINKEKIDECIKITNLTNLIKVKDINHLKINEQGSNLSGGQIQMIGVARAIYKDPKVLIFDEPTNNLDGESKNKFFKSLRNISNNRICIIISHDENIRNFCDKTIVLKNNKLIEE